MAYVNWFGRSPFRNFAVGRSDGKGDIWTEAEARNYQNQRVADLDSDGKLRYLMEMVRFDWPKPLEGEDLTAQLDWKCIATIIAKHIDMKYDTNGDCVSDQVYLGKPLKNRHPLRALGYLGWSGITGLTASAGQAMVLKDTKEGVDIMKE